MPTATHIIDTALALLRAGICVIPIRLDLPKQPALPTWKEFEKRLPTESEIKAWFRPRTWKTNPPVTSPAGLAAVSGKISGNLECLDFDEQGLFEQWADQVDLAAPNLVNRLVIVRTPNGVHCRYRCSVIQNNDPKIARRPATAEELATNPREKTRVLIESRGEGGYALLPGSPPECHEDHGVYSYDPSGIGDLTKVQSITPEERETLWSLARSFNRVPEQVQTSAPSNKQPSPGYDLRPGQHFDIEGDWQSILEQSGWTLTSGSWDQGRLCRPGKIGSVSATIGVCRSEKGEPLLHVFSSNCELEVGTYGKFRAYAGLRHNGDLSKAAAELGRMGFGSPPKKQETKNRQQGDGSSTQAASPELIRLRMQMLSGMKAKPVYWLVDRKIPSGKISLIAGIGGTGKSTLVRHLIACLTTGRPAFGLEYEAPPPVDVLLISVEDSPSDTIVPHLRAEKADLQRVHMVLGSEQADGTVCAFSLMEVGLIAKTIREMPTIKLIVIDPIMSFVGRAGLNENSSSEVRTILDPLMNLADETGVAILLIAHLNKSTTAAATNRIVGSTSFRDACRTVYFVCSNPDEPGQRLLTSVKENVPGLDTRTIGFSRRNLTEEEAQEALSAPEFSELSDQDRKQMATQLAVVEVAGTVEMDADTALVERKPKKPLTDSNSKISACADWVKERVGTRYAWPDSEIEADAIKAGYSVSVYRKAKATLGKTNGTGEVQSCQQGVGKPWLIGAGNAKMLPLRPDPNAKSQIDPTDEITEWD